MIIKNKGIERSSCNCGGHGCDDCAEMDWGYVRGLE